MRSQWKRLPILALTLILIAVLAVLPAFGQAGAPALVRFVHVVPGAAAIDIYTDGVLTVSALPYGQASAYIALSGGSHRVTVTQSGVTTPLWNQEITTGSGTAQILVASSTNPLGFQSFPDDLSPLDFGKARLTAIHAIANGPAVDVILEDGRPVIPGLVYNIPYGTLDVPSLTYPIAVVPEGAAVSSAIIPVTPLALNAGTSYVVIAYGTTATPRALVLSAATEPNAATDGFVRFVHGVAGAPDVDIYINDALIAPSLSFEGSGTEYIALPAGQHDIAVRAAGGVDDVLTGVLEVTAGSRVTAVALGTVDQVSLVRYDDQLASLNAGTAIVNVINALGGDAAVSVALSSGNVLVTDVAADSTASASVTAQVSDLVVTVDQAAGSVEQTIPLTGGIYGGVYYDILVVAGEDGDPVAKLLTPASIAQAIDSAPGETTVAIEEPPVEVAVQPTPAPVDVSVSEVVVSEPTPVPPLPTPAPTRPLLPAARVNLDPGANLQLRQYPSSSALSLGLAPSGSILAVNGRQGPPAPPVGATPDPNATPEVDPASLLEANQDLNPAETWLFITYPTPDGGSINAWVNALYLVVSDVQGRPQRLADLPTVPSNRAGEAFNTAIQPPSARQNVVTVTVINLDPGVNVNIRRTVGTQGESLARVPAGTVLGFEGVTEDRQWVFVSYVTPEGGTVTGWINALYASLAFNNAPTTYEELTARNLLIELDETTRGTVSAGVAPIAAPTQSVVRDAIIAEVRLDPGANLHLRRRPNVNAESLALIPSGTQLVVNGRTELGDWLAVSFENINGWVSSQFVFVTRNGRSFDILEIPIAPLATPTLTPFGFVASPTPPGFVPSPTPSGNTAPVVPGFPTGQDDPNLDPVPGG
jgi:uncharacterized protein YraI